MTGFIQPLNDSTTFLYIYVLKTESQLIDYNMKYVSEVSRVILDVLLWDFSDSP